MDKTTQEFTAATARDGHVPSCVLPLLTPALLLLLSLQHHHHWPDSQGSFISKKLLTFLPWVCFLPGKDTEEQRKKPEAQINTGADRKLVHNCTARKG